jgi:hypothetical protein
MHPGRPRSRPTGGADQDAARDRRRPSTEYVRILGAERVEVFVDATRDTETGPEARWSRWLCQSLHETNGYLERVNCREIPLADPDS